MELFINPKTRRMEKNKINVADLWTPISAIFSIRESVLFYVPFEDAANVVMLLWKCIKQSK